MQRNLGPRPAAPAAIDASAFRHPWSAGPADYAACVQCLVCTPGCAVAAELAADQRRRLDDERSRLLGSAGYAPRQCWHCRQAACVEACPAGAMQHDAERGIVYVDRSRCIGCWMCVLACPCGAVVPGEGHYPSKCDGCRERPAPLCADICAVRRQALAAVPDSDEARCKQKAFAAAGWGWQGIDAYPAAKIAPPSAVAGQATASRLRYVIVGGGIAAVRAVEAIRQRDQAGTITVVCGEPMLPYSRVVLPQYLSGERDIASMLLREPAWWQRMNVELLVGVSARQLDEEGRQVLLEGGRILAYDRLLAATGAAPARLEVPGAELAGVACFHALSDAESFKEAKPRAAVVVGGGFVALKAAEALHAAGVAVTLVVRSRLLRRTLDATAARLVEERLHRSGIRVMRGALVREIEGRLGRVAGVRLVDGRRLACEAVVAAAGTRPCVEWLCGSAVRVERGVVVGEDLRTTAPDVWAAGDVAQTYDLIAGRPAVNAIWPAAAEQGRLAGAAMAGERAVYDGSASLNTLDVCGLAVASFGEVPEEGTAEPQGAGLAYASRSYRDGRLVGAVMVGDIREAGLLLAEARRQAAAARATGPVRGQSSRGRSRCR